MIRVRTASRLHFGLLNPGAASPRRFGGCGLMVDRPGLELLVTPAAQWSASGPLSERALEFARRFADRAVGDFAGLSAPPCHIEIVQAAPEHHGFGTGTQLGLAVARGLSVAWGLELSVAELALRVGRGLRSALGVYGFARGGFLVDAGKKGDEPLAPLVAQVDFPEEWRFVLSWPRQKKGIHGATEASAFQRLEMAKSPEQTDALCRLVLLGMLPALRERDAAGFGAALYEFNRKVGEMFAPYQGGVYSSSFVSEMVRFLKGQGVGGVGQSSWGPLVFALAENGEKAEALVERLEGVAPEGSLMSLIVRAGILVLIGRMVKGNCGENSKATTLLSMTESFRSPAMLNKAGHLQRTITRIRPWRYRRMPCPSWPRLEQRRRQRRQRLGSSWSNQGPLLLA